MRRPVPWAARLVGVVGGNNKQSQRARGEPAMRIVSAPRGCRCRELHESARAVGGALGGCRRRNQQAKPEGPRGAREAQRKRASRVS